MSKRIVIAGLLGGVGMFIWSSIAHIALPLGQAGLTEISNDQALIASMRDTLGDKHGLYFFPSGGMNTDPAAQEQYAMFTQIAGFVVAGIVAAALIKTHARDTAAVVA